jgi:hypothetical protein
MNADKGKWTIESRNLIKAILGRQGIKYEQLVEKLNAIGVEESVSGIKGKIHRGTYSFIFMIQVMKALDVNILRVKE